MMNTKNSENKDWTRRSNVYALYKHNVPLGVGGVFIRKSPNPPGPQYGGQMAHAAGKWCCHTHRICTEENIGCKHALLKHSIENIAVFDTESAAIRALIWLAVPF